MILDPERTISACAAALASLTTSMVTQVSVWFGVPAPTMRQLLQGLADAVVGVFLALLFGYGFAVPAAILLSGLITVSTEWVTHAKITVDPLAGGIVVGSIALRVVPLIGKLAEARLRKKFGPQDPPKDPA